MKMNKKLTVNQGVPFDFTSKEIVAVDTELMRMFAALIQQHLHCNTVSARQDVQGKSVHVIFIAQEGDPVASDKGIMYAVYPPTLRNLAAHTALVFIGGMTIFNPLRKDGVDKAMVSLTSHGLGDHMIMLSRIQQAYSLCRQKGGEYIAGILKEAQSIRDQREAFPPFVVAGLDPKETG
ncbi:unnamed protein product [marine sediment metagenome]|uniref:Uncharacterized protein n=1 Tax=marine sediment metagenome TaxID=412755 RepID=X0TTK1_9ZZZZ